MHDVLRQRLIRRLETLPEAQLYQVLDYIEFMESKYGNRDMQAETSGLQRFAESMEDRLRKKAFSPQTLREAFQLIAAADRVLSSVSTAGKQILNEVGAMGEVPAGSTLERPSSVRSGSAGGDPTSRGEPEGGPA